MIVENMVYCRGLCSIDGLKLPVESFQDPIMENASFNSWSMAITPTKFFVFAPDGMMPYNSLVVLMPPYISGTLLRLFSCTCQQA